MTIGEAISRLRISIKAVKQDAALSDRFLYSLIMKHGKLLMRRQDNLNRIMKFNSIFRSLDFVELEDVDKIAAAACIGISSNCKLKRTKEKLPDMIEGYWGVLIRDVTSIDGVTPIQHTYATKYDQMSKQKYFKYNNQKYYWYLDGHLYFPNIDWDAIKVIGVFEGDLTPYVCQSVKEDCIKKQDMIIPMPEFLFSEIETMCKNDLVTMIQIPTDTQHDVKNIVN